MARDYFDESKNKKKVTKKKTEEKKPQSSSVTKPKATTTKVDKVASKSTFLGGGAPVQKVEKAVSKPKTVKKPASQKKQTITQEERINQKSYGTTKPNVATKTQRTKRDTTPVTSKSQRQINAEANMNLKQRNIRDTTPVQSRRTQTTTAAQRQKMGMPTQQDLKDAKAHRRELANDIKASVREASSETNKGFMQRQKSGTLTTSDKKRIEQTNQRRAEVARNTRDVAKKAVLDTGSGYAQSLYDLTELTASNKNGTKAKAMKMGLDPVKNRRQIAELEREQKYTAAESKRRRDELFQKQEQRQAEWDERTKNAKGLEKAWYGAVESGTGMVADTLVGAATGTGQFGALASMGLRTYGSSANQARKEGATDKEARLYGLAQSAKEMGTELMFQGAGLAKAAYGRTGLSLADKSANILTRGLTGLKADAVGAGVRALGGTAEENIEELAGWMADPLIKELTYGKAVRNRMKENLRANIPQIGSDADAANVASYFSTPKFTNDLTNEYVKSGMSKDKASALAAEMRDYYVAYYSGDKGRLDALEEDLAAKLSGQDKLSFRSWSMDELKDTFASTTLLTLATGLPGAVTTSVKGNQIFDSDEVKSIFGNDAVRKVADAVKNTSNREMSLKAETMEDRLNSGKDLTGTQKYDLYQGYIEKVNETSKKARASQGVVENARREQNLVPTMGVDRAGNTVYAKETQREYDEKYAETAVTAESLRRFMESDNSISDDEIRRTDAAIKAVSDLHVGGLTIGDAHEFAYGNNLARETLKIEEGIDLDRYIVRKADGTVDLAATNEATENALFRINADNAIKAAQAETEVFIDDTRGNIDKDLLTRFGNNGQAVWKEVNKDLDPRNLQEYLTNANAASYFYSAGRNTDMGVDSAVNRFADTFKTVDKSLMKRAFAAGARDRIIANTPGYGQTVESGSNIQLKKTKPVITGQLIMDDDVVLADSDQSAYLALAMSTNTNIHIVSSMDAMGKDGKPIINQATGLPVQINGMSRGNDIFLNMNAAAEKNLGYVFMHEMTHQIKQYAPNEYLALENLVRDRWFNKDAIGMQAAIKQRMDLYSVKGGQQLTEEEAVEEIIADAMAEAMDDPEFAAQVCEEDINLGQAILNSIRAALRSIRQMFANIENPNDRFHNSLLSYLGILDQAEKMWLNALATAKQNKADGLIADWQARANRYSVGYHAGDLGKSTVDDYAHQGGSRGSGHFGFGTYFVGDEEQINYGNYGKRKHEAVDFDKYNLFKPRNFDQGLKLHDALRTIDGIITDYSDFIKYKDSILNEKLWNDEIYRTSTVNNDIERLVDDYEMDGEPDPKRKERIDKFISEMPEYYRENIEREAQKKYDNAQSREVDEDNIREYLTQRYELWGSALYDNLEDFVNHNLESEIRYINNEKAVPYEEWYYEAAKDAINEYSEDWANEKRTLTRLADDLQRALNYEQTSSKIERALLKTEEIVKGYQPEGGYRLDAEPGLDSGATVFMKQLGYEGVDVRHIPEMDNTGYGSVIYDLKGEDLARKQEIGTARFSITPQQDADYMDAVEAGDMETAQRMVDEAAAAAMPYTKLKGRWYHGTENEFTVFNFSQGGKNGTADGFGIYLTNDPEVASSYGNRMIEGYVNVERPASALTTATLTKPELHRLIRRTVDIEAETLQYDGYDSLEDAKKDTWISNYVDTYSAKNLEDAIADVTDSILQLNGNDMDIVQEIMTDMGIRDYDSAMDFYDMLTEETGIDGFETKWGDESEMADPNTPTIALAFRSNQIKSADPVTYAEDGSVIPLSERFDPKNDDIRYSLPTQDSDGKILTDGQMEYFKNSQARDIFGRLVPVYHATDEGGFTIFDPWKSDDHRSLFFSNRRDVAKTYAYNGGNAFDFAPKKLNSWNDLIQYGRQLFSDADMSWDNDTDDVNLDFELHDKQTGDWADIDYDEWLDLANSNDPHADDYRVRISLPYNNKDGETETVSFEGDSMSDLLNSVANGNIPHGGHYQVYLNLENPLIIEGHGQPWNDIVDGGATFPSYSYVTLKKASWFREEAERRDEMYGLGQSLYNGDKDRARADEFESDDFVEIEIFDGQKKIKNIIPIDEEAIADELAAAFGIDDIEIVEGIANELAGDMSWQNFSKFYGDDMRNTIGEYGYDTREWAEFAEDEGYDGVIIRNIVDIDNKTDIFDSDEEAISDIYIAFSSNQIKDVNNENPTENPDIRYSITPEDEAMEWLASQYELDDVPLEDEQAEEGRVRMAKSKKEFIKSKNALWNERWLTEGKVLNVKSVRKNIKDLVTGVMANSDTDHKYKSEVVDKTLIDAKSAYWLMKEGKHSEAAEILWNSAVKMIENVDFIEDITFNQYKDLRDYMRTTNFRLGEEYWSDVDFSAFRKRNFGRIKLVKGETNIDQIYQELQKKWPEWFDEDEQMTAPDQLLRIEEVLDAIQPYRIAYSSEEAEQLAGDIADTLYDIVYQGEEYKSIADTFKEKYDAKTKALKARHKEALQNVRNRRDELIAAEKERTSRQKERAELWKSRTFEEKAKRQKDKDVRKKAKYFGKISDNIDWLTTRLLNETKDKNIPEGFRRSLAHMLMQFDMQTEKSKELEEKYGPAKKTLQMRELKNRLEKIANEDDTGEFRYDGYLFYLMDALAEKVDGKTIDALDTEDLIAIDTMLKSIVHNFRNYNKIRLEEEKVAIANVGDNIIEHMDERIRKYGKRKAYKGVRGYLDKLVNEGEETPIYFFERLDPTGQGIGAMYKELRRGEDRHIQNMNFLRNRFKAMFSDYFNEKKPGSKLEAWRDTSQAQTFDLQNGSITLNPAQIMSLYCLSKRPQAMGHILGAGIVASPVSFGAKMKEKFKGNEEQVDSVMITYSEVQEIIATLTEDQVHLADEMQSLMNNEMAAWGNETSLELHGIKLFRENDYFPIKSSNEVLDKSADKRDVNEKIKNFGFTKPLTRNANNAIMIDDIFSVVADHCNKMSLYNAMAIPITDFMRVYNYKQRREGEKPRAVQAVIGEAFTRKANDYILKFISDVNGNTKTRSDAVDDLMNKTLANYKKASIGFNARVALQQPTAIFRSLMVIDSKYFAGTRLISPKDQKEMFEHCPIALWKSWGHYDMDMGRDIEDIMMNNDWSRRDALFMGLYGMLDNMAWGKIWQAVKNEVKDKHRDVKVGSDEFYRLCNERASEIFDKTQVVDSIFHRSDTMRSKNTLTKMATSFMAEPTLTYNVFRDSLVKAHELRKDGKIGEASKLLGKMMKVLTLNAIAVSASAALWDAVRGKGADDDDDDENLMEKGLMALLTKLGGTDPWTKDDKSAKDLWLINALNNFSDNAPWAQWNNVYFVKDIVSLKDGWGTSNMALEGWETLFKGFSQAKKKITEGSDKSWYDIWMNIAGGLGYVTGYPAKTFFRDLKAILEKFGVEVFAADGSDESTSLMDNIANKMGYRPIDKKGSSEVKVKDSFLAQLGIGKTEEEKEQDAFEKKTKDIADKYADLSGEEKDKKVWSSVTTYLKEQNEDKGVADMVTNGDYITINKYRQMYLSAGGNAEYFDNRILAESKKALKKSIKYGQTNAEIDAQNRIKSYMMDHGVTEQEISEVAYRSDTAKDMKIAFIINDKDAMIESLEPLVYAGLTYEDLERIWENRNRIDIMKYKSSKGRYADRLKSTGKYIWPTDGVITSHFGYRNAPTAGASSNHPAIDIGAPQGTAVVAADGGVVISAGANGGYGNSVGIKHDNGMITWYNHLYSWNVKVGDTVAQGQQIAQVGSTGISTGPHLDFKIMDTDGNPVDPEKYLEAR